MMILAAQPVIAQEETGAAEYVRPVKLMTIDDQTVSYERRFFGRVFAKQTVDLSFQTGGELAQLPVVEGSAIQKGDLVAQLDLDPFERAVARAELSLQQAQRDAARSAKLQQARTLSQAQAEAAQTQAELAEIALRDARAALEDATLHAPFDAVVSSRNVENYSAISAGMPVARLLDMSELRIHINVPEVLVRSFDASLPTEITAVLTGLKDPIPVNIVEFKAEASQVGQTYELTLALDPDKTGPVLPGTSATVSIKVYADVDGAVLPASAIKINADKSFSVFIYEPAGADQGTVREVAVQVKPAQDGKSFVVSGLPAKGEVVAAGVAQLHDGETVRRFAGFGD